MWVCRHTGVTLASVKVLDLNVDGLSIRAVEHFAHRFLWVYTRAALAFLLVYQVAIGELECRFISACTGAFTCGRVDFLAGRCADIAVLILNFHTVIFETQ
jgi:hypothetical protein